jgi:hypothetical protein
MRPSVEASMRPGGLYDQMLVAVHDTPERRLDQLCKVIWNGHANGTMTDEAAGLLGEAIERRREVFRVRRQVRTANRRAAAWRVDHPKGRTIEKRRLWTGSGALPHTLRTMFTNGELAVASVIRAEVQRKGRCTLPYQSIAKAAGLRSTTVVKRFIRQAKKHYLIKVEARFGDRGLNRPNVITIISKEWISWIAYEGRAQQGGTAVPTDQRPRNREEKLERTTLSKTATDMMAAARIGETEQPPDGVFTYALNIGSWQHEAGQVCADRIRTGLQPG